MKSIQPLLQIMLTCIFVSSSETRLNSQTLPNEASWTPLQDDPSRAKLFDEMIVPRKQAGNQSETPTDLAIPKTFIFPEDARFDAILKKPRANAYFGMDISHYTGEIDFRSLHLQEIMFVYAKATQGVTWKDDLFSRYWDQLGSLPASAKIYRGAYHFLSSQGTGADQASSFVKYVSLHGGFKPDDMPPCVDLEWDKTKQSADEWRGHAGEEIIQTTLEWLKAVESKTGRKPCVYTATAFLQDHKIPEAQIDLLAEYPLWIADYSPSHKATETPSVPAMKKQSLWQFTSDSKLTSGHAGGLDASVYYGTEESFYTDFAIKK